MHLAGITIEGLDLIKGDGVRSRFDRYCPNTHSAYLHLEKKWGHAPEKGFVPFLGVSDKTSEVGL